MGGTFSTSWDYRHPDGALAFTVVRFDLPTPEGEKTAKVFRPFHHDGKGWVIADPKGALPLYRMPSLHQPGPIVLTEGEKAAEAAVALGFNATTSAHGADGVGKADWTPLAGREVWIVPDEDEAGQSYAERVIVQTQALSPPARVKVVRLPNLPPKGDIVEFVAMGRRAGQSDEAIKSTIEELASQTEFVLTPAPSSQHLSEAPWLEPHPLPPDLPPVAPFDPQLLPDRLRPWVMDVADRMQCPIDFVAVPAMVALAGAVGKRVGIRPKRFDDWLVVPNLWGAIVGRPGVMKSPAISEAMGPLHKLEGLAKREHDEAMRENAASNLVAKAKERRLTGKISEALEQDEGAAMRLAREAIDEEARGVVRKRFVVNDVTVEKLGEILNENPLGVLVYRDELVGTLRALDKEGQECARAFFLECWNGSGRYTFDRIGRGTTDIESTCICILGGIQPGPLAQYLRAAAKGGRGDDGLMQRFQLVVWPDIAPDWKNIDRTPDQAARDAAFAVYEGLAKMDATLLGADPDPHKPDAPPYLRFDDNAQAMFDAWREGWEKMLRCGEEHPSVESHLSKYRKLVPALALLIHLADGGRGPVTVGALWKALGWVEYLESHARRIYAEASAAEVVAARLLARKILAGVLPDRFALRDVYRRGWTGLGTPEETQEAVGVLLDLDWLREVHEPTLGRTRTTYEINPRVKGMPVAHSPESGPGSTDKGDRSPSQDPSVGSVGPPPGQNHFSEGSTEQGGGQ